MRDVPAKDWGEERQLDYAIKDQTYFLQRLLKPFFAEYIQRGNNLWQDKSSNFKMRKVSRTKAKLMTICGWHLKLYFCFEFCRLFWKRISLVPPGFRNVNKRQKWSTVAPPKVINVEKATLECSWIEKRPPTVEWKMTREALEQLWQVLICGLYWLFAHGMTWLLPDSQETPWIIRLDLGGRSNRFYSITLCVKKYLIQSLPSTDCQIKLTNRCSCI